MVLDRTRGLLFFPSFARNVEGEVKPVFGALRLSDVAFGEMSLNETILSYGELLVLAHDRESRPHVGRIVYDEDHVDLDRDTLTATRELELGTSDWALDSDADGVDDGVELGLFETSPSDATSRPPVAEMAWRWGPSTRLDLERRTEAVFQPQRRDHGVPADCEFTPDGPNLSCSDLGAEDPVPALVRFDTVDLPTPDFQTRFRRHDGPDPRFVDGFERYDLDAATPNALLPFSEPGVATVNSIVAVSADTLYLTAAVGPSGALRLWRVTADGSVELDPGSGCPLAPADPACGRCAIWGGSVGGRVWWPRARSSTRSSSRILDTRSRAAGAWARTGPASGSSSRAWATAAWRPTRRASATTQCWRGSWTTRRPAPARAA